MSARLVAELAGVRESIASTTWSRGWVASMGIAPNARSRFWYSGQRRRMYARELCAVNLPNW